MAVLIDTDLIVQGGRTFMARNAPKVSKHETFGLGRCNVTFDKLYKALIITEVLDRENSYTQEQIQCLESELLNEIQTQENLQGFVDKTRTPFQPPAPPFIPDPGLTIPK